MHHRDVSVGLKAWVILLQYAGRFGMFVSG
jgi:hypothetical protein